MLDQFERNKFFLSNIFFYSVGRDILIIKESSQNSPLHYKFYPHSLQYIYIYTWTSARDYPRLYRSGWYLIETNAKRRKRERNRFYFVLSFLHEIHNAL